MEYIQGGGITGAFLPKNVGNRAVFEAGEKRWEFEVRHERLWYEMPLGPPRPDRTSVSGFMVSVWWTLWFCGERQDPGILLKRIFSTHIVYMQCLRRIRSTHVEWI